MRSGAVALRTAPPTPGHEAAEPDPAEPGCWIDDAGPPTPPEDDQNPAGKRRRAVALMRIVHANGSVYENLSVPTGRSPAALKSEVDRTRAAGTDAELDPDGPGFTPEDVRALSAGYKNSKDQAVRAFMD